MKNQNDIIKLANQMQKDRDLQANIAHESPETDINRFEQSLMDVFCGDEIVKPKRTDQDLIDAGHKHGDF
jgi:hypothetical protein